MKCPLDQIELQMSDRQGIEIDYCPQCRGVWLDRGEIDKLIERSSVTPEVSSYKQESRPSVHRDSQDYNRSSNDEYSDNYQKNYKKRKKESFLGEIFDF